MKDPADTRDYLTDKDLRAALLARTHDERKAATLRIVRGAWLAGWDACDFEYRAMLAELGIHLPATPVRP